METQNIERQLAPLETEIKTFKNAESRKIILYYSYTKSGVELMLLKIIGENR